MLNILNNLFKDRFINRKFRVEFSKKNYLDDLTIRLLEKERNRIADLLHDNINPLLIALKHQVKLINLIDNPKLMESKWNEIYHLVNEIIAKQNELIANNGLNILSIQDFEWALNSFANQIRTFQIILDFEYQNQCFFGKNEWNHIYSVVLELITNMVKHEKIDKLYLKMKLDENLFKFYFKHNGMGINKNSFVNQLTIGRGLQSIKKRLNELNGSIEFQKLDNQFITILEIPFCNEQGN